MGFSEEELAYSWFDAGFSKPAFLFLFFSSLIYGLARLYAQLKQRFQAVGKLNANKDEKGWS